VADLRDLEADRWLLEMGDISYSDAMDLAFDLLDELDRLKGLLVYEVDGGWLTIEDAGPYPNEAAAWAAVRKAAMKDVV
jgi:hypothetical protein